MCGLSAIVSAAGNGLEAVQAMSRAVRHRGPDDEGLAVFHGPGFEPALFGAAGAQCSTGAKALPYLPEDRPVPWPDQARVAFAHRRLSILDLSAAGHQPMCSEDRRLWLIFNGEIYNHLALRDELAPLGHRFFSHTDSEILLAAYREWGPACLHRLAGMFAFIVFDRQTRRVFCARDRFGIKPLYYCVLDGGRVAFASEIKQFMSLRGFAPRLNAQRAYDYLAWAVTDHTDETLFEGVYQLRGGQSIEFAVQDTRTLAAGMRLPVQSWYTLRAEPFEGDFGAAARGFRDRFQTAVTEHLRSDVPVGSCLSGGLDSSSIVCVMSRLLAAGGTGTPQHTFSARSHEPAQDEGRYIEAVVRATRVRSHEVYPEAAALFAALDDLVWHQDEPFGSSSVFAQSLVFELAAKNGVKVVLDGQGSDEQLAGYRAFFGVQYAELLSQGRLGELARAIRAVRGSHGLSYAWSAKMLADSLLPEPLRQAARKMTGHASRAPGWLDLERLGARCSDPYSPKPRSVPELSRAQLCRTNLQMLLHWEDRDSMNHSIEARVPFLDHRLVEYVLGLPTEYKVHQGITKRVLRDALQGVVPESVLARRDKIGFVTPEETWMRREPQRFRTEIERAIECSGGILRSRTVEWFDAMIERRRPFDFTPWRILCFGRWMRRFEVQIP
jgi:asparagine synthase (glutamine-hydrolysing)